MGSLDSSSKLPWFKTPCVYSPQLSQAAGCNIYLKLENLQPSGSFKSRGIGNLMNRAAAAAVGPVHFYCSSGGNAGLACATTALALGHPATIVVPILTPPLMKGKLADLGVEVIQVGNNWAVADQYLRDELLAKDPTGVYVPPFDHPHVWEGAATMIPELKEQMEHDIDAIVCSVGGGGLLNGIMQGIESIAWLGTKPQALALETTGADSLNASIRAESHVTLPGITSIAISLGAPRVSEQTWKWSQSENLQSLVVSDADAAMSCVRFANDARHLVEAACGATLAAAYRGILRERLGQRLSDQEWSLKHVVLVVCGGSNITLEMLQEYKDKYSDESCIKAQGVDKSTV
ncbi:tryptophan synthase beta subunit-like PLP-dependent enzyme [Dactylonectria macrodidyma]|uniref:L-serine ammonia-lyase n=1 Tax=Dactylonectria macrodidyma TaxID=307937 RepID=A0A9P9JK43_9HYPO|nr:tryptophan synthase beta subunit-like PLP-dependent enzyme [Dactylonectria macrodidyma]